MVSSAPRTKWSGHKQQQMGPAPFASFEDLSDDLDSPEEKQSVTKILPGIREDVSFISPISGGGGLQTPSTPRIDISRASSSSHHDSNNSRDSSPERELFAGPGELSASKLDCGFKEEDAADLRSSTEELDFHEESGTVTEREEKKRRERLLLRQKQQQQQQQQQQHNSSVFKYELEAQSEKERKDSACSDVALLSISGRTSRLSSVGSGGSGASHISGMSHLSIMSSHSVASSGRSPSPHKMLLETSFCGNKPIPTQSMDADSTHDKHGTDTLEKALLSRKIDPTVAIIGEIKIDQEGKKSNSNVVSDTADSHNKSAGADLKILDGQKIVNLLKHEMKPIQQTLHSGKILKVQPEDKHSENQGACHSEYRNEWQLRDRDEWGPHVKQKPISLNLSDSGKKSMTFSQLVQQEQQQDLSQTGETPLMISHQISENATQIKVELEHSMTPSPLSTSRKNSFATIFKKTDDSVISPELLVMGTSKRKPSALSSNLKEEKERIKEKSQSRSSSHERAVTTGDAKGKKDTKNKSVFSSLFKKRDKKKALRTAEDDILSPPESSTSEQKLEAIVNVEFTFSSNDHFNYSEDTKGEVRKVQQQEVHKMSQEIKRNEGAISSCESESAKIVNNIRNEDAFFKAKHHECATKEESMIKEDLLPSESFMLPNLQHNITISEIVSKENANGIDHQSSESERESDIDYLEARKKGEVQEEDDHERKGLVIQQDSFDELPYIPTTLPQERSVALPIVPIKQRVTEVKTCPIERPRSTTPINPSLLEDYFPSEDSHDQGIEKMRICLPREDSITSRIKSPRRITKSWFEFAEQGLQSPREYRKPSVSDKSTKSPSPPPPLPPRTNSSTFVPAQIPPPKPSGWINFEEIPEKRKAPKQIQTIPSHGALDLPADITKPVGKTVYNYVNPEECKCECHETTSRQQAQISMPPTCSHSNTEHSTSQVEIDSTVDRHSYLSDSSYEYPNQLIMTETADYSDGLKPMTPFGMDLDITSNRSSIMSQEELEIPE